MEEKQGGREEELGRSDGGRDRVGEGGSGAKGEGEDGLPRL